MMKLEDILGLNNEQFEIYRKMIMDNLEYCNQLRKLQTPTVFPITIPNYPQQIIQPVNQPIITTVSNTEEPQIIKLEANKAENISKEDIKKEQIAKQEPKQKEVKTVDKLPQVSLQDLNVQELEELMEEKGLDPKTIKGRNKKNKLIEAIETAINVEEESDYEEVDLEIMTDRELKIFAKENDVDIKKCKTREEIMNAIEKAFEETQDEDDSEKPSEPKEEPKIEVDNSELDNLIETDFGKQIEPQTELAEDEEEVDLELMSDQQLKDFAKEYDVDISKCKDRLQIMDTIEKAFA